MIEDKEPWRRRPQIIAAAVAALVLAAGAWMFRYEPMATVGGPIVWDRWTHQICVVWVGGHFNCGVPQ